MNISEHCLMNNKPLKNLNTLNFLMVLNHKSIDVAMKNRNTKNV
jgi:hypothetical protein